MQQLHPAPDAPAIARLEAELAHLDRELESLRLLRESCSIAATVVLLAPFFAIRALTVAFVAHPIGAGFGFALLAAGLPAVRRGVAHVRSIVLEDQQERIDRQVEAIQGAGDALGPILEYEAPREEPVPPRVSRFRDGAI